MNNYIERYVYDVSRRLPEADREEVKRELRSNIYDMLSESPQEQEIKDVLLSLGSPAKLAEQYRQKPRYLISPAVYDDYIRIVKLVLPIVGTVLLVLGTVMGTLEGAQPLSGVGAEVAKALSSGTGMAFSGMLQALFWITMGFAIADRAKNQAGTAEEWSLSDLPDMPKDEKSGISLSESIVELSLTFFFGTLAILFCLGIVPFIFSFRGAQTQVYTIFSPDFLRSCVPVIAVTAGFEIIAHVLKIQYRRWTVPVCVGVILSGLASVIGILYLAGSPVIFSGELLNLLNASDLSALPIFSGSSFNVLHILLVIVTVASVFECVSAVRKTMRERSSKS